MPNNILKILLKSAEERNLFELTDKLKYIVECNGRELKYFLTIDYLFNK